MLSLNWPPFGIIFPGKNSGGGHCHRSTIVLASACYAVSASSDMRSELERYPSLSQERKLPKHLIDNVFKGKGGFELFKALKLGAPDSFLLGDLT